jgi:hypothetical protein
MFSSTKNTTQFWYPQRVKFEAKSPYPFGSYPKPQISDLVVLAAYPFGSILSSVSKGVYRYGMNTQEKDNEIYGEGNSYSAEYWQYDARLGRRWNVDPKGTEGVSNYSAFANNPIWHSDIKGDTAIIMVWGTGDGSQGVGHAAIAIQNYKEVKERVKVNGKWVKQTKSVPDGTYTVRDLWPGVEANKTNFSKDLPAAYSPMAKGNTYTLDQLKNTDITDGSEGRAADGLILLPTTASQDRAVNWNLDLDEQDSKIYNGVTHNCSDYVASALVFLYGTKLPETRESATETLKVTTPNQVYKAAAGTPNAKVIKDAGASVAGSSLEAATGGKVKTAAKIAGK